MSNLKKTFTALILFFAFAVSAYGQSDEELVREAFENYKSSILNNNGNEAVKYVDSRTIEYYSHILDLVKNADSAKVESLPFLDRLLVLSIRHRTSKENILSLDGKGLLILAIENGMVGKSSVENNSIGKVTIDDSFARGQFVFNGQEEQIYFDFYKEDGQWKLDLTSLFPLSAQVLEQLIYEDGQDENEFLFTFLEMVTGKKPGAEIWQPVNK
jgi:hypothetical protein